MVPLTPMQEFIEFSRAIIEMICGDTSLLAFIVFFLIPRKLRKIKRTILWIAIICFAIFLIAYGSKFLLFKNSFIFK